MYRLHRLGFWFSRPPTVTGWLLSRLGWEYTHVGFQLEDCVYEVRLDSPSEWIAETDYRKVYPGGVRLEVRTYLDLHEVCEMLPKGVPFQFIPSVLEYLDRPSFAPQAWNCLAASRKVLEYLGRPSDAVTPDHLYTEVLDFQRSLRGDPCPSARCTAPTPVLEC